MHHASWGHREPPEEPQQPEPAVVMMVRSWQPPYPARTSATRWRCRQPVPAMMPRLFAIISTGSSAANNHRSLVGWRVCNGPDTVSIASGGCNSGLLEVFKPQTNGLSGDCGSVYSSITSRKVHLRQSSSRSVFADIGEVTRLC